jgi:BirA family biotin operon repressor/biotin-[acetyl-CoA-carboxylase] ligase
LEERLLCDYFAGDLCPMEDIYSRVLGENFPMPVLFKAETGSTSVDAREMLKAGAVPPFVTLAGSQLAGYGRRGTPWIGDAVGNLYMSWALKINDRLGAHSTVLPQYVATKICSTLKGEFSIDAKVKYPNDIFVESGKVGGLLLEVVRNSGGIAEAVLGIGVNVLVAPKLENQRYAASCLQDSCADKLEFAEVAIAIMRSVAEAIDGVAIDGLGGGQR